MSLHRGSRKARSIACYVTKAVVEELEQRQLLTIIHGGESLIYQGPDGATEYRVVVSGPSSAQFDLIGATEEPDPNAQFGQSPVLNDIPAAITHANGTVTNTLGGIGGAQGVQLINGEQANGNPTPGTDSTTDLIGGPQPAQAPSAAINVANISSDSTGRTYGFNVLSGTFGGVTQKLIELVSINYRNVTANGVTPADAVFAQDLGAQIVAATGALDTSAINSIIACDFLPSNDNLLYFAASVNVARGSALNPTNAPSAVAIPFLLVYDFSKPVNQRVSVAGEFISDPANGGDGDVAPTVQSFSFTSDDELVAMVTGRAVGGRGDTVGIGAATGLVNLNLNNLFFNLFNIIPVTLNNTALTDLHSLEVIPGDDDFVYGITGTGTAGELLHVKRVNPGAGIAVDYGPLVDPSDTGTAPGPRGAALGDLAWNPVLVNPFVLNDQGITRKGVLIAEDTATDELLVVDSRNRFPATNLFSIYGTNTTPNTTISVSAITGRIGTPGPHPDVLTGSVGPIQVADAQGGPDINVTAPGGAVLIGMLTLNLLTGTTTEENRPVLRVHKTPSQVFGNFPKNSKYVYAGIRIPGSIGGVLIGGTVTGDVAIGGSANLLYAGDWLTGDANGILEGGAVHDDSSGLNLIGNIYVGTDLHNFVSTNTIGGTDDTGGVSPDYLTGFNMAVGGRLGNIQTPGAFLGAIDDSNTEAGPSGIQTEIEDRRGTPTGDDTYFSGFSGEPPSLGDLPQFNNDTFATAQYLGPVQNNALGNNTSIVVQGQLENTDADDYYRVSLLGGQTVTVDLNAVGAANVGVFDPDGRLINSDRMLSSEASQLGASDVTNQPFQFTADRPGDYRFAVGASGDAEFNGASTGQITYTLRITGVGNVGLGGMHAGGDILTYETDIAGISVHRGDLGGLTSDADLVDTGNPLPYQVDRGNLRSIVGADIGRIQAGAFSDGINFLVPGGSVGLLRTTAGGGIMDVNTGLSPVLSNGSPNAADAIGQDYQLVDAAGDMTGYLLADRAIGTIRTASMATDLAPYFIANADQKGQDGIIDLIDDAGDFGVLGTGGPHLYTGPGGNVRYIRVAGTVFKSSVFGGGQDVPLVLDPGQTIRMTDDSGTAFKLTPTPLVNNPNFNPANGVTNQQLNPGTLSILSYSVDDHKGAGVVLINVTVTGSTGGNHGLLVESGAQGTNGSVDIGTVTLSDAGVPVTETAGLTGGPPTIAAAPEEDPTTLATNGPDTTTPIDVVLKGPSTVDVWSITGNNIGTINNETDGEIVNVSAASVGAIDANTIGLAKSHTGIDAAHSGNAVNGEFIQDDQGEGAGPVTTPFIQQRNLIDITGDLVSASAREGIGNILVAGIIGSIVANSDGHLTKGGGFEGIDGPIVAIPHTGDTTTDARIQSVNIGQGVEFGGRGDVPYAGIFAGDAIQSITGSNADIRGPIQVGGNPGTSNAVDGRTLTSLSLKNGSIIGTFIGETDNFNDWRANRGATTITETVADNPLNPTTIHYEIGSISLKGDGGIIGTFIEGADIGPIGINGGFGFLNSNIASIDNNRFAGITTTGYGIRDSLMTNMSYISALNAEGTGKTINPAAFDPGVLISAKGANVVDPFFGTEPNSLTDLYRYLGTTPKNPIKKSISASGVIQDVNVQADGNLDSVSAYQIRHRSSLESMNFAIGQTVGTIVTTGAVDGLTLSGGSLNKFVTGNNVDNTSILISGPIKTVNIGGTLKGSSVVQALGAEGTLGSLTVKRGLYADVNATVSIGSIVVGADLGSHNISTVNTINLLQVGGSIFSGVNVANILDHKIRPFKRLIDLEVAGNIDAGATIRVKTLNKQHVGGVVNGNIIVG